MRSSNVAATSAKTRSRLSPRHPIEEIGAKFLGEHQHDDDEVRCILGGKAVFVIRPHTDRWMHVVEAGDLLGVPAKRANRFFLTEIKRSGLLACVRRIGLGFLNTEIGRSNLNYNEFKSTQV